MARPDAFERRHRRAIANLRHCDRPRCPRVTSRPEFWTVRAYGAVVVILCPAHRPRETP